VLLPTPRRVELTAVTVPATDPDVVIDRACGLPPEGYRLVVGHDTRVRVDAADEAGAFYARVTLAQLTAVHGGELPVGEVQDWPDLPVRGVLLDISRDKVPTTATLRELVVRLASWKVNQLQLYVEHTFAYAGHEEVWRAASPLTPDEVRDLDAFCAAHHIELVANQNCLGHFERWLRHERYRPLALRPEGMHLFGRHRGPMTLDPADPGSLALVRDLLGQLLGCFTSRRVHVGLDEPWELPAERLGDYTRWVRDLTRAPELAGRDVLVWGDVVAAHPELLADLPDGVTVCEWGYEADHPFDERAAALAGAGRPFWVSPGTSSWLSLLGRSANMRANTLAAADAARAHGGSGLLTTDWGDLGHLQYLPVSEPGLAWAAAVAWCAEANRDLDLAAALDAHVFHDPAGELGGALLALGDAHRASPVQFPNVAVTVLHLYYPDLPVGQGLTEGVDAEVFEEVDAVVDRALAAVGRARSARTDAALVAAELANAGALVRVLNRDARARLAGDGTIASVPVGVRADVAADLDPVLVDHAALWHARNREGGLADSLSWLVRLQRTYETGEPHVGSP
jgi:hypothetical protein